MNPLRPLDAARNKCFTFKDEPGHNQVVVHKKKPYVPPRLTAYDPKNVPGWLNLMQQDVLKGARVPPTYTTVVDQDRKYVEVSESFSELVGYKIEELIGTQYDHLTVPNTADILTTYNLFTRLGYLHGLWMLSIELDTAS